MKNFFVYILCNKRNGTLYTGITSDLIKRVHEHKNKPADGFTKKYNVHNLVWYEIYETAESAITREKRIKKWLNLLRNIILSGMIYIIIFVRILDSRSKNCGNDGGADCGNDRDRSDDKY